MSAASATSRATLKEADEGVGNWIQGILTGNGSSVSQIIVSGVLSVIPGVGQAMDARDLIIGIVALSANPLNAWAWAWVDMIITLVGLIPGFGDAFKVAFKFIRHGHPLGRVLDAVSPRLRGNVENWLKHADWDGLTSQLTVLFRRVIDKFIDALDSWLVKAVAGNARINRILADLKVLRNKSQAMIREGMDELKKMHARMMGDAKPRSTHEIGAPSAKPAAKPAKADPKGGGVKPKTSKVKEDHTAAKGKQKNPAKEVQPNRTTKKQKREDDQKKWHQGVLPEHITDYYAFQSLKDRKINDSGRRREERDNPKGRGIDHIWRRTGKGPGRHAYIVGETKGSLAGLFAFTAQSGALGNTPWQDQANLGGTREIGDDATLKGRTADGKVIRNDKGTPMRGLPGTKTKGTQMSHKWIAASIKDEKFNPPGDGQQLQLLAQKAKLKDYKSDIPWDRWICLVTAKQMTVHRNSKGRKHQLQPPIVTIPDTALEY